MRWAWLVVIGMGLLVAPQRARAESSSLSWLGPACSDSASAFEARLAQLTKPEERAKLAGTVSVKRAGGRFQVRLALALRAFPLGERRFETTSCKTAAETAAVVAAMAAFPQVQPPAATPDVVSTAPPPPKALPAKPETDSLERPVQAPPRSQRFQPRLGLLGFVQGGVLPSLAWGGALELGLGVGQRWSLAVQGAVSAEQSYAQGSERRALLRVFAGAARGCFAPFLSRRLRVDACGGLQVLAMHGRGEGFDINRSASLFTAAPLLAVAASLRAPEFLEWRLEVEAAAPLSRQRFLVDGREVTRAAAMVFAIRLGPVLRF